MSRRPAMTSNHDNQYGAGYDAEIAANPATIIWRKNGHGIQIAVSVHEPSRERAPRRQPQPFRKTHCGQGHEYTEATSYIKPDGTRACRRCKTDRQRQQRAIQRVVVEAMELRDSMEAEAAEVAERFRKHHTDNTSLMRAVRREI